MQLFVTPTSAQSLNTNVVLATQWGGAQLQVIHSALLPQSQRCRTITRYHKQNDVPIEHFIESFGKLRRKQALFVKVCKWMFKSLTISKTNTSTLCLHFFFVRSAIFNSIFSPNAIWTFCDIMGLTLFIQLVRANERSILPELTLPVLAYSCNLPTHLSLLTSKHRHGIFQRLVDTGPQRVLKFRCL